MKKGITMLNLNGFWISKDLRPNKDCYIDIKFKNEAVEHYLYIRDSDVVIKNGEPAIPFSIIDFCNWRETFYEEDPPKITKGDVGYNIHAKCCNICNNCYYYFEDECNKESYECSLLKEDVEPTAICQAFCEKI